MMKLLKWVSVGAKHQETWRVWIQIEVTDGRVIRADVSRTVMNIPSAVITVYFIRFYQCHTLHNFQFLHKFHLPDVHYGSQVGIIHLQMIFYAIASKTSTMTLCSVRIYLLVHRPTRQGVNDLESHTKNNNRILCYLPLQMFYYHNNFAKQYTSKITIQLFFRCCGHYIAHHK